MNAPLRRVGVVVFILFTMLFVNLNYQQWYKADEYRNNLHNSRLQDQEYGRPRGTIALANGEALAQSQESADNLKYLRVYPFKDEYAHVVGYKPVNGISTDIERLQNEFLTGNAPEQFGDRLAGMFTSNKAPGGIIQLTLSKAAQDTAFRELSNNQVHAPKGAVVALDPKTGALLAEVSMPSFDPNPLVGHNTKAAGAAYTQASKDPNRPMSNRATSEILAPGSTMKVIVSAAALAGGATPDTVVQAGDRYAPPQGGNFQIKNASPNTCPEQQITLKQALTVSCNTAFSRICVEQLSTDKVKTMAQAFGFESEPKFTDDDKNIMGVAASHTGLAGSQAKVDPPTLAQTCIGQRDVRMTPLQGALIAATVANNGKQMRPYLVATRQNSDFSVVNRTEPSVLHKEVISNDVAQNLQDMMISVVESSNGTGKPAKTNGLRIGGKTGTAENGEDTNDHGWFIGFAMKNNQPVAAVAVVLEGAGKGGSHEAARIAGQVMKAYADERGNK